MGRKKFFNFKNLFLVSFLAVAGIFSSAAIIDDNQVNETPVVEKADAADYSNTIRVYVDLTWNNIDYVRLGTDQVSGAAALTTSNAKYNQSLGKYVRDISSSSTYDKMGFFFSQSGTWWFYQYDNGYVWRDGGFKPGYEYQLKNVNYVGDSGNNKKFSCDSYEIGEITDNVTNPTVYFVNGYSWTSPAPYVHYWGGTASSTYPGSSMTAMGIKIHCLVGDTWYDIGIFKYTISGSVAYVQFNNNSQKTGDLRPVNGQIYWYGADAEKFGGVASFLVTFTNSMGSYKYNGKTYPNSLCAFSSSTASSLVSSYNSLSSSGDSDVVTSITNSTINTYSTPVTSPSTKSDIKIPVLMEQVNKNISVGVYGANRNFTPFSLLNGSNDNGFPIIIIIIASSISLLSITALSVLIVKKRKTKKE